MPLLRVQKAAPKSHEAWRAGKKGIALKRAYFCALLSFWAVGRFLLMFSLHTVLKRGVSPYLNRQRSTAEKKGEKL